jgi:DtxR family Mn-dependent transcriptional regulator
MSDVASKAEQDYLKQIYLQQEETGRATTQLLADRLGVKPPSVTAMLKRLAEHPGGPYVRHTPYHGVVLTEQGLAVALEMLRHHRLIELFLAELLDVPWDQLHQEAERLEHVLSEELEERIAAKLGNPSRDPHGDPIPRRDGTIEDVEAIPLTSLPVGKSGTITRVPDGDPELLKYLQSLGLVPDASVTLEAIAPYGDILTLRLGDSSKVVGGIVAERVHVVPRGERRATGRSKAPV